MTKQSYCYVCRKVTRSWITCTIPGALELTEVLQNISWIKDRKMRTTSLCTACANAYYREKTPLRELIYVPPLRQVEISSTNEQEVHPSSSNEDCLGSNCAILLSDSSSDIAVNTGICETTVQSMPIDRSSASVSQIADSHHTNISNLPAPILQIYSTRAMSSQPVTQINIKKSQTAPFPNDIRIAIARLYKNGIPFYRTTEAFNAVLESSPGCFRTLKNKISEETATRCVVEMGITIEYVIAELLSRSKDIFLGFDGTSIRNIYKFVAIDIGGVIDGESWFLPLQLVRATGSDATYHVSLIQGALQLITQKQHELGIPESTIYDIKTIIADNCSLNMGKNNGICAQVEELRRKCFEGLGTSSPFVELLSKGCTEHILCLVAKNTQIKLCTLFTQHNFQCLIYNSKETIAMNFLRYITNRFRNHTWGNDLQVLAKGFLGKSRVISVPQVSYTRYLSFEHAAYKFSKYYFIFLLVIVKRCVPMSKFWTARDATAFSLATNPIVIDLVFSMAVFYKYIIKPFRSGLCSNQSVTAEQYRMQVLQRIQEFQQRNRPVVISKLKIDMYLPEKLTTAWQYWNQHNTIDSLPLRNIQQFTRTPLPQLDQLPRESLLDEKIVQNLHIQANDILQSSNAENMEEIDEIIDLRDFNKNSWPKEYPQGFYKNILGEHMNAFRDTFFEHDKNILLSKCFNNCNLPPTSKALESSFDTIKDRARDNINTRPEIFDSILKLKSFPDELFTVYNLFAQYGLISQAYRRLSNAKSQQQYRTIESQQIANTITIHREKVTKQQTQERKIARLMPWLLRHQVIKDEKSPVRLEELRALARVFNKENVQISMSQKKDDLLNSLLETIQEKRIPEVEEQESNEIESQTNDVSQKKKVHQQRINTHKPILYENAPISKKTQSPPAHGTRKHASTSVDRPSKLRKNS